MGVTIESTDSSGSGVSKSRRHNGQARALPLVPAGDPGDDPVDERSPPWINLPRSDSGEVHGGELAALEQRIGRAHLRQRLGLEEDHEVFCFDRAGAHFFYPENWYSVHGLIRYALRVAGLYDRAQRNARTIRIIRNPLYVRGLPRPFEGLRILQLSDLHTDLDPRITSAIAGRVREVEYDLCVLTGDYRALTYGPFDATLEALGSIRVGLKGPVYAVLGNHDSIRMVAGIEAMGIRVLLNELVTLEQDGASLHLAGIDDAHYYQVHNIHHTVAKIPPDGVSLLLSHTPEVYRHAAHAGFQAMLAGHTHGGQICLPGGYALTWDARCPRRLAAGPWIYGAMTGYTSVGSGSSVVNARLNCLPEITVHELRRA